MKLSLDARDDQVWRHIGTQSTPLPDCHDSRGQVAPQELLESWARRYARAVEIRQEDRILEIGREMLDWLNQGGALSHWLGENRRELEIAATSTGAVTEALLAAPWEILADASGFLATDRMKLFLPLRRVRSEAPPFAPIHSDLAMLFMAVAPEGQYELDYEAEEAAILDATRDRNTGLPLLHVTVEESGELGVLADRLRDDGPFDILHLSCHGDILKISDKALPVLLLETETGAAETVTPDRLLGALGERVPPLLFLSACRTGQRGLATQSLSARDGRREGLAEGARPFDGAPRRDAGGAAAPELAEPLARQMAAGVPHVLGWDGSVYDADAAAFAEALYAGLGRGESVAYATAKARHAVMEAVDRGVPGQHWHLARVYLGPGGGGVLCDPTKPARPAPPPAAPRFLDDAKQVRVAGRNEFVGRRRQLQRLRRGFAGEATGALIYGMGNLGKSSLAARLADRMGGHQLAVVFGHYDGLSILAELERVAKPLLGKVFQGFAAQASFRTELKAMSEAVRADEAMLEDAMGFLFDQVFAASPILLVIDDFERALEKPAVDQPVVLPRLDLRPALGALLRAFAAHRGQSRLLITSRYDFALPDRAGDDLAAGLLRVPLVGMRPREQQKQWQAKARGGAAIPGEPALVTAALAASAGNPGLQDVLTRPILKGEAEAARAAVEGVAEWRATGKEPADGNVALEFFTRMSFGTYAAALTETELLVLAAACLFAAEVPVPRAAVAAVAGALGVAAAEPAIDRLLVLGLFDDFGALAGWPGMPERPHLGANPLARPMAPPLEEEAAGKAADAGLAALAIAWCDAEGDFPMDLRAPAACRLALRAAAPEPGVLEAAALAAVHYIFNTHGLAREALALAVPAVDRLQAMDRIPGHLLAGHMINAAGQAGDVGLQERLLELALRSNTLEDGPRAQLLSLRADVLQARGDLDEALRIRTEEMLPAFKALGDKRSLAVTKGQIADVLQARGDLDEALEMHLSRLPDVEAMGDLDSLVHIRFSCACLRLERGDHQADGLQTIATELAEAWNGANRLRRPDAIGAIGALFGQVLAMGGLHDEAVQVLETATAAFDKLGKNDQAAQCRQMIAMLEEHTS